MIFFNSAAIILSTFLCACGWALNRTEEKVLAARLVGKKGSAMKNKTAQLGGGAEGDSAQKCRDGLQTKP